MIWIGYLDLAILLAVAVLFGYTVGARDRIVSRLAKTSFGRWFGLEDDLIYPLPQVDTRLTLRPDPPSPPRSSAVRLIPRRPWDYAVDD